ncbi:MAG: glycosyltransferase family 2 protein, partial [Pseudomonadota bacterium]
MRAESQFGNASSEDSYKSLQDLENSGPLVSVVIPLFNKEDFVCQAVKSVLDQTYKNLEILVIDDCSTDSSLKNLESLGKDPRVVVVRVKKNQGVANARNQGIDLAKGEYVCFLDSDDMWSPAKVEQQLEHLLKTGADVCCTGYRHVNAKGKELRKVIPPADNICYEKLLNQNVIGCSTVMAKKEVLRREKFKNIGHEDFCFWLDLLKEQRTRIVGLKTPLVDYRIVESSLSRNKVVPVVIVNAT